MSTRFRQPFPTRTLATASRYLLRSSLKGLSLLQRDRLLGIRNFNLVAPGQEAELDQLASTAAASKRTAPDEPTHEDERSFRPHHRDEEGVVRLIPYLDGVFPPSLSDPFPAFAKRRGAPLSRAEAKQLAELRRRLAKQHDLARKKRDATEKVAIELGTEVLRVASTGWSGVKTDYGVQVQAAELEARGVELIRYEGKPTALVTSDGYQIVVRTSKMSDEMLERLDRFTKWMHKEPQVSQLSSDPNQRGAHRLGLYGTTRAYSKHNHLTAMHKQYPEAVHRLLDNPDQIALSQWVTNALRNHFGDVYHRYMNADPGRKNPNDPLRCRFGAFPLFCFNFSGDEPVECVPHTDYKNPAGGICAVMAYGSFDSTKRHWLFFHDLGVALELPAGCCALYPSSLLLHSNVSLVEADSEQQVLLGKGLARGSMVWFAQATYMMLGELGMTASEAKKAGLDTEYEDVLGMFPQEML